MNIREKELMLIITALFVFIFQTGCGVTVETNQTASKEVNDMIVINEDGTYGKDPTYHQQAGQQVVYLAGGCFWGTEKLFSSLPGVIDVTSGYANGKVEQPTYEQVCSNMTGARETVRVIYDPAKVKLTTLLDVYFAVIDTTVTNRQGNDVGSQYQTGIYYRDKESGDVINTAADHLRQTQQVFAVEVRPLINFYDAETYHQHYLDKNPGGYCHITPGEFDKAQKIIEKTKA